MKSSEKTTNEKYNPSEIEAKWQKVWEQERIYSPNLDSAKRPFYNLMMFPYPSAEGMHVGNMYAFTGADVYGRFQRMQRKDVFEPIGLDGFGIHSENYAIKVGKHPVEQAKISEKIFYRQLKSIGNSFDWTRTVETYKPEYYKWTQWLFIQLFKAGLAYRKRAPVNFCPSCKTVLADEQVIDKACERCETIVQKRELEQWFFKITDYSERLLNNIEKLNWTEKVKIAQRDWIGKSEGARIKFKIKGSHHELEVFTTRPDTIFGATFLVVAPEHPLVGNLFGIGQKIMNYISGAVIKKKEERGKEGVDTEYKAINPVSGEDIPIWISEYVVMDYGTGAIMGVPAHDKRDHEFAIKQKLPIRKVIDPHNEFQSLVMKKSVDEKNFIEEIQANHMWVVPYYDWGLIVFGREDQQSKYLSIIQKHLKDGSWYVDADGSLKAVIFKNKIFKLPREHSQAFEHGKKIGIPLEQLDWQTEQNYAYCFDRSGQLVNSGKYNGLGSQKILDRLVEDFPEVIKKETTYHLRDWLISRQRYWGPPIPMIHCDKCKWQPVPEKDLPVKLPFIENYKPLGTGKAPLASHPEFYETRCPNCKGEAKRETDVSDTFLDSAWYFLRYISTDILNEAFDTERVKKWFPVNMYIGGAEHSVLHLLYSRFITMVLKDLGFISFEEPFTKFRAHGLIVKDGAKMSKSKGNVVVPDSYIKKFGADTLRAYLMFMGPFNQGGDFRDTGIEGMHRFLRRVWTLAQRCYPEFSSGSKMLKQVQHDSRRKQMMHKTIKKVTDDISNLSYNTAIAALMEWYNYLSEKLKVKSEKLTREEFKIFSKLIAPFAPHISEELYQLLNDKKRFSSIHSSSWPTFDPKFLVKDEFVIIVQVNGKLRGNLVVDLKTSKNKAKIEELAKKDSRVQGHLKGKQIKKIIYVPEKVINFAID